MDKNRQCGDCSACCHVAEVKEGIVNKPACSACPFLNRGCTLFDEPTRPLVCSSFQCSWLRSYGNDSDRPDKSGVMVSVNHMNGGTWINVMDLVKNAHLTTGKNIIVDVASKVDYPVIIVDYDHLEKGMGDFVIIKQSLEANSNKIKGELISTYTDTMKLYKLIITSP
jgi:hypothetical protein